MCVAERILSNPGLPDKGPPYGGPGFRYYADRYLLLKGEKFNCSVILAPGEVEPSNRVHVYLEK